MKKNKEPTSVYVKDIREWASDCTVDQEAQHLAFAPTKMIQLSSEVIKKLMRYKCIAHLTLEGC